MNTHCISLKTMIACLFWGSLVLKKKSLTTVIVFSYLQWLRQWRHSLCSGLVSGDIPCAVTLSVEIFRLRQETS